MENLKVAPCLLISHLSSCLNKLLFSACRRAWKNELVKNLSAFGSASLV